ncbi:bifunctional methylenetetrahydrofolate dehydrogenase/methenyltetrahydrofolate cyclohydrolase FolD [bacterium]|nr:bifunctional methylenetetrahydrofolate dehydrogenase/methenyltetrahydrofolate cyclohydrolase FolD [bacterium]MBT3581910.1 bifunctional methylenetetrahydrofolate dehydrogenase/methenyltetrahydrofolate cyclohydrolase FolD [bacterium]MBT4551424.1 bifunctional methylenetetrahydrofolate dehydrogenase/methenyltetrahydrofolate cyclohydrolase FolD [bacterium]MBT7088267.1 bifunctional methylenetetrahydrofolate dehydrogenase/methenyltetrahydrofolate cyclohydrolase FolD [bacterium]
MTKILNGKIVSDQILAALKKEIATKKQKNNQVPGLAVILVGEDPASTVYVRMKKKRCGEIGIQSFEYKLPADTKEQKIIDLIKKLNHDPEVHGILLQVPLPPGLNEEKLLSLIDPAKDVDGFHPINVGNLLLGRACFKSCTPYGVCKILEHYQIPTKGKHVVILGRSNIVGKPLAAMLIQKDMNATVTICHSQTQNLKDLTKQADILIAAIGKPLFVTSDMVKKNAIVIDVGINRVEDKNDPRGYKIVGDVDYDNVLPKASAITPVPGGVGAMTIAMLMTNTVRALP